MILAAPTNSFVAARERLGPYGQRRLAMSQLSTYETLWGDGELALSGSLPDSEGKRMW